MRCSRSSTLPRVPCRSSATAAAAAAVTPATTAIHHGMLQGQSSRPEGSPHPRSIDLAHVGSLLVAAAVVPHPIDAEEEAIRSDRLVRGVVGFARGEGLEGEGL